MSNYNIKNIKSINIFLLYFVLPIIPHNSVYNIVVLFNISILYRHLKCLTFFQFMFDNIFNRFCDKKKTIENILAVGDWNNPKTIDIDRF